MTTGVFVVLLFLPSRPSINHARAATAILLFLTRSSADGAYTIFAGTSNEIKVFCDMTGTSTGCGGGGWTLVMRIDGQKVRRNMPSLSYTGCIKNVDVF